MTRLPARITCVTLLLVGAIRILSAQQLVFEDLLYEVIEDTGHLQLLVCEQDNTFIVRDERSGKLWTSFVPTSEPAYQNTNKVWQRNMRSLFTCTMVNELDERASKRALNLVGEGREISSAPIPGGIRYDVWFSDYRIGASVEVTIDDRALTVHIAAESVREEGQMQFISITPLPFFGYAHNEDEGYMVLPDGCGALYRYKPSESQTKATEKLISWYVYAHEEVSFEKYMWQMDNLINTAYLPVYGVKIGDDAFLASVEEGDTDAYLQFYESGLSVDLSRMNVEYQVRHPYDLFLSDIAVQGAFQAQAGYTMASGEVSIVPFKYDPDPVVVDRTTRYEFLTGDEATYAGMARRYRKHLLAAGALTGATPDSRIPLALSLFGGIFEERLLFDKFVPMTTFEQAAGILQELRSQGISKIYANLIGWSKDGYGKFPRIWPPDRSLGGRSGLRELGEAVSGDEITLYLQVEPITAVQGNGRFSRRNDVVKQLTRLPVRSETVDENMFLLNPQEALERVSGVVSRLEGYGVDGIAFESIGDMLVHDYNSRAPCERHDTLAAWIEMLDLSSERLGSAALIRGNIRQASSVDLIMELPMETSGYMVVDEAVPFYQMVLHGSLYYTTDPENLFYDTRRQFLQWIETGAVPYYVLTFLPSENLAYTEYNHLFTSHYEDWIGVAADRYHEFNREFGAFYHLDMVDHARVAEGVVRVTYADGSRIYLNYSDEPVSVEGVAIEGLDYRVVHDTGRSSR